MEGVSLMRYRTINGAFNEIRAQDPETNITLNCIRQMIKNADIPCVKTGRKTLINFDALLLYLGKHKAV